MIEASLDWLKSGATASAQNGKRDVMPLCPGCVEKCLKPVRFSSLATLLFVASVYIFRRLILSPGLYEDPSTRPFRHFHTVPQLGLGKPLLSGSRIHLASTGEGGAGGERQRTMSFWHGLPLYPVEGEGSQLVTFVCEIPHGASAKLEVSKELPLNPIVQDVRKDGSLRHYPWRSLTNYGMLPQTYEDPSRPFPSTGLPGDGDPLDAVDLWPVPVFAQ